MFLHIPMVKNVSSCNYTKTEQNIKNCSRMTFSANKNRTDDLFVKCKKLTNSDYEKIEMELPKLEEFAKSCNKEIILKSKDGDILMIMRPLKKDSSFYRRLLGMDTSRGLYYPNGHYTALWLAKGLLEDQQTGLNHSKFSKKDSDD